MSDTPRRVLLVTHTGRPAALHSARNLAGRLIDSGIAVLAVPDGGFELEIGAQRTWSQQAGIKDNNAELFLTVGLRYDFYADDTTNDAENRNCATPVAAALCRYSTGNDKSNCVSPPPGCR